MALKRSLSPARDKANFNTSSNGHIIPSRKVRGNLKKISWINVFWKIFIISLSRLLFVLLLFITSKLLVKAQEFDYDLNSTRVTFYPESLMISHNPHAIIFYQNTHFHNLFVDCAHQKLVTILTPMIPVVKTNLISCTS